MPGGAGCLTSTVLPTVQKTFMICFNDDVFVVKSPALSSFGLRIYAPLGLV